MRPRIRLFSHDDIFGRESVRNANAVDDALRELAPVVRLPRENITMLARYEHVAERAQGLEDVLIDVAPLARPQLGAAGTAADRRSAQAHRACAR